MITLALDTSGPVGSVAVLRHSEAGHGAPAHAVLSRETLGDGMRHGVDLFPAMERALKGASLTPRDIGLVAVGTGPGSYTGLRVGITAARAFAYATGARLLGVPSCDAWAAATDIDDRFLAVILDAKVKAVYLALYRNDGRAWVRYEGPELLPPEQAAARLPAHVRLVGDGVAPYAAAFAGRAADEHPGSADAVCVARIAMDRDDRGERDPIEQIVPLYLRRTEAEIRREAQHG
ncbi:MAG: tRNA (adenosine(37)-N6)-threonylcarbamoyltransferase complex dimerization subunit type 1 TsaB [Planctomycetes bacterium]|nr:tRNA (adenosine(37)-N6)-threonylcarbamoyltransferase complex dimerization subunit type 1 TsaB [Planctomycetota bacterium]